VTPTDKSMPVDVEPVEGGNLVLVPGDPLHVRPPELGDDPDGPRWVSHFATCPNAALHRKKD
jgi:hypothetical protein